MSYLELEGFKLTKKVGEGAFGKVYKGCKLTDESVKVAVKVMTTSSTEDLEKEVRYLQDLQHPGIVNLVSFGASKKMVKQPGGKHQTVNFVVYELLEGGELFDLIAEFGGVSERIARYYCHQMVEGLEYLHSHGVCHRDMKPENILLDSNFNLKIADFGWSKAGLVCETQQVGTKNYMPPETISGSYYSGSSIDLFSAAIILFIILTGHPPFGTAVSSDPYYQ